MSKFNPETCSKINVNNLCSALHMPSLYSYIPRKVHEVKREWIIDERPSRCTAAGWNVSSVISGWFCWGEIMDSIWLFFHSCYRDCYSPAFVHTLQETQIFFSALLLDTALYQIYTRITRLITAFQSFPKKKVLMTTVSMRSASCSCLSASGTWSSNPIFLRLTTSGDVSQSFF